MADVNAGCEGCHAEIAREWRTSMHHRSTTDPVYQRGLAIEPEPFCRGCHAPEADPSAAPPQQLADLGVGCVTCHETGQGALAARGAPHAPHPVRAEPAFATGEACAGCHDFTFPAGPHAEKMQATVTEASHAPSGDRACASCHMPLVGDPSRPHRAHMFRVGSDTVRAAASVAIRRVGTTIEVTLQPGAIGHAFPTGDLFRRLEVEAVAVGADHAVVAERRRYLTRHLSAARGGGRSLLGDDRVGLRGDAASRVVLDLGVAARGRDVDVRVAYQRVENPGNNDLPTAIVESEVILAESTLPPE